MEMIHHQFLQPHLILYLQPHQNVPTTGNVLMDLVAWIIPVDEMDIAVSTILLYVFIINILFFTCYHMEMVLHQQLQSHHLFL